MVGFSVVGVQCLSCVWCGCAFNEAAPICLESEYRILIACNGKITTQYLVNQQIVVGELVASYFY